MNVKSSSEYPAVFCMRRGHPDRTAPACSHQAALSAMLPGPACLAPADSSRRYRLPRARDRRCRPACARGGRWYRAPGT
jgi:hypothetical protein